jgi:hypothetical protein
VCLRLAAWLLAPLTEVNPEMRYLLLVTIRPYSHIIEI